MTIIAMTREMGSLGKDVAEGLARELGLKLLYHQVIDAVSEKMHLPQNVITRFLQGKEGLIEGLRVDKDALSLYTAEEVLDIASRGNLMIRGWGATCLLRPVSHIVCVHVCAPLALRTQRIMERLGIDDPELAQTEIKHNDAAHAATMLRRFGIDWQDSTQYDLILNTERVSVADCIEQIAALSKRPAFQETAASRAELLNLSLSTHIHASLRKDPKTRSIRISIANHPDGETGTIVLRGIVLDDAERRLVEDLATRSPGVRKVVDQLQVMVGHDVHTPLDG